jgi:hypothetical protein
MRKVCEKQFKLDKEREIMRELAEQREKLTPEYTPPAWIAAFRNRALT